MDFVPMLALTALVMKIVDFLKNTTNKRWSDVVTQIISWSAGVIGVLLFGHSDFAGGIQVGDAALSSLNFVSQVLVGLSIGSIGGVVYDYKKAIDTSDTAKVPSLPINNGS